MIEEFYEDIMVNDILDEVRQERLKQKSNSMDSFDRMNTKNDWIAYITSYTGDAADKVFKKQTDNEYLRFRDNMLKVAALAIAAIESLDKGNCR